MGSLDIKQNLASEIGLYNKKLRILDKYISKNNITKIVTM